MRDNAVRPRWAEMGGVQRVTDRRKQVRELERCWRRGDSSRIHGGVKRRKPSMFTVILIDDAPPFFCLSAAVLIIG